jgi:DNA-binding response OmpR family regulator
MAGSELNQNRDANRNSTSLSSSEGTSPKPLILIVEDNQGDVFLIREAIARADVGATVHVIFDGQQAMRFFDAADTGDQIPVPALVLLDLNLPKNTGEQVLSHLRRSPKCSATNVLILTSSDSVQDRKAVNALGARGYFRKPSDHAQFMKLGPIVRDLLAEVRQSGS